MTQSDLAKRLEISYQSIAQWETGKRNPKISSLEKIAEALSIPVEELSGGVTMSKGTMFFGKPASDFLITVSSALIQGKQILISPSDDGYKIFEVKQKELN